MISWNDFSWAKGASVFTFVLMVFLMVMLGAARTDATLISVWQVLPWTIVPVFAIGWLLAWVFADQLRQRWQTALALCVGGISFGVSLGVYMYGFGFDPFIHQAAARALAEHGTITLPSPLYAGYYGLLAVGSWLTPFSVSMLDRALVPLATTLFFAWWVMRGTARWQLPSWAGWGLLLLPFAYATFSVPYHLSIVMVLALIACLPQLARRWWVVFMLGALALVHPLLLVPAIVMVMGISWVPKSHAWGKNLALACSTAIGILGLFWLYTVRGGGTLVLPSWASLRQAVYVVTGFPYRYETLSLWLETVWRVQHGWVFIATAIGIYGLLRYPPKEQQAAARTLVSVVLGTSIALVLVAACASFENILPSEQYEFALRLRNSLPWLVFPGLGYVLVALTERFSRVGVGLVGAAMVGVVWYTSYPLYAPASTFAAPGLGRAEVMAFEQAEVMANGQPYASLAPQMVSAAALRGFGFERSLQASAGERYPYAIPTGGELYAFYLQLWTERDPEDLLKETCTFARVPQVIVILPTAWDPNRWIDTRLAPFTTRWTTTDMRHRLYRYPCEYLPL